MNIIGKTPVGFLLEAHRDEIYNLIGFYSFHSKDAPELNVGDDIKIGEMYRRLYDLREKRQSLDKMATELEFIASLLREKDPIWKCEETIKGAENEIKKSSGR